MYKTLTGDWRFRRADQGDWMPAKVPGCNFLDLMAAGKIPDPFVGMNEKRSRLGRPRRLGIRKAVYRNGGRIASGCSVPALRYAGHHL